MENTDRVTWNELVHHLSNRLSYSQHYAKFYIVLMILSFSTLLIPCGPVLYIIESFLTVSLLLEVVLRMMAMGFNYFHDVLNIVDLFVLLSVVMVGWHCDSKEDILFIIRCSFQAIRVLALVRKQNRRVQHIILPITEQDLLEMQDYKSLLKK
eukprot:NODE_620_length_5922_cov_0.203160.p4 type:complete len:153 gc:universal NODE_620_length_5922_cov_0.203160:1106-1564(+)